MVVPFLALLISFSTLASKDTSAAGPDSQSNTGATLQFSLPWTPGDSWMCSQSNNGITHQDNAYYGFDFWRPNIEGSPVLAATDGRVVALINTYQASTWPNKPFTSGNLVILDHGGGFFSQYGHLKQEGESGKRSNAYVQMGQTVKRGQRIGSVGNTGTSSGPHLHFQVQNGPFEWSNSVPARFEDAPSGAPETNRWYKPMATVTDQQPPKAGRLLSPAAGDFLASRVVQFKWSAALDDESGLSYYIVRVRASQVLAADGGADLIVEHPTYKDRNPQATAFAYTFPQDYRELHWTVTAVDFAGNQTDFLEAAFAIDTVPPEGFVQIAGGRQIVKESIVDVQLSATDPAGPVAEMMVGDRSDLKGAKWEPYTNQKRWQLTGGQGENVVYARFRDRAGNQSSLISAHVWLENESLRARLVRQFNGMVRGLASLFASQMR